MDFLQSAGVLIRPEVGLVPNISSPGRGLAESYLMAYQELEKKNRADGVCLDLLSMILNFSLVTSSPQIGVLLFRYIVQFQYQPKT